MSELIARKRRQEACLGASMQDEFSSIATAVQCGSRPPRRAQAPAYGMLGLRGRHSARTRRSNGPREGRDRTLYRAMHPQAVLGADQPVMCRPTRRPGPVPISRSHAALGGVVHGMHPRRLAAALRLFEHTDTRNI